MKIIDRNDDFYDHFSHIYGIDDRITFDRRKSVRLTNEMLYGDHFRYSQSDWYYWSPSKSKFHLLEVGYVQYIIQTDDVKVNKDGYTLMYDSAKIKILHVYNDNRHFGETPIFITSINLDTYRDYWRWRRKKKKVREYIIPSLEELMRGGKKHKVTNLPIFRGTLLTKVLDAEKVWREIQTYISSLDNDKDISIEMTEKQKARTHGFDKYSFRHPVK